jgi:hypothetical protein
VTSILVITDTPADRERGSDRAFALLNYLLQMEINAGEGESPAEV